MNECKPLGAGGGYGGGGSWTARPLTQSLIEFRRAEYSGGWAAVGGWGGGGGKGWGVGGGGGGGRGWGGGPGPVTESYTGGKGFSTPPSHTST